MSDGALSQDEIDALLGGVDSSLLGGTGPGGGGGADGDRKALEDFLGSTVGALSSNLAMMTGAQVTLNKPSLETTGRDAFLQKLPETVTAVKADFTSGFPGDHIFIMGEDTAKKIAALMNKEENIELDDMAMSVIGEVVSQLTGTQITSLTDKTGNKNIAVMSPEAANVPKAVAALPGSDFIAASYDIDLGDGAVYPLWEIFGSQTAGEITAALGGGASAPQAASGPAMNMGAMPGMGAPNMAMPAMMPGMMTGMTGASPANVQSVQFPGLSSQSTPQEQGNIGLIMDVYMEMTVELGRTRKLIKEILGMGEGTIIELDKLAGEPVDILVNHKLIAKGEVVVIDENFGVRVTEIVSPMERMSEMG
ncbi:MAG: flagellar motor switch protein FliN [Spirochaetaceae bacterium]|jgi:flagellar motor switch protein FliN/FliY|nr:flagellar motor switch protein FliN [Spirochaetaceae bacterium]